MLIQSAFFCRFCAAEDQEQVLGRADVKVFQQGQVTTTVSVVDLHPDR